MSCCFDGSREWGMGNRKSASRLNGNCFHVLEKNPARHSLFRFPIPHSPFPAKA